MAEPIIEVSDLVFEYPTTRALRGVGFTVMKGAICALVGPNGAGKTTLMRCIAALETPYSGQVRVDGIDTEADPRAVHRKLGYLRDLFGLYDELTVERCLLYAALSHGAGEAEAPAWARRASGLVGLDEHWGQRAGELSRGWRQRLGIAQALIHNPAVLLLDEPASGLDPDARSHLAKVFRALQAEGMTLMVSSHILSELEEYCTEMLVLADGRIAADMPGAGGAAQVQVTLDLAAPFDGMQAVLAGLEGVTGVRIEGARVSFLHGGSDAERAALLARLVGAGAQVANFSVRRQRLEDAYFARVHGEQPRP